MRAHVRAATRAGGSRDRPLARAADGGLLGVSTRRVVVVWTTNCAAEMLEA